MTRPNALGCARQLWAKGAQANERLQLKGSEHKEIAARLHISSSLVKKLQQRIFLKLGVHSRTLAVNQWHKLS
jgi:DNA-binding NarL/FixJ family response regulator